MSHIDVDFEQVVTAEQRATEANEARREKMRAECRRNILAVVDETDQANLTAAALAGLMDEQQTADWRAVIGWINAMRTEYKTAAATGNDADWPAAPVVPLV